MSSTMGDLALRLTEQLKPLTALEVIYGSEGFSRDEEVGPFIQIVNDPAGDSYEVATTARNQADQGPPATFKKWTGVIAYFKGASSKSGATIDDHIEVVEGLVDLFLIQLLNIAHSLRQSVRNIIGFFVPVDPTNPDGSDPFAQYTLKFQYGRGVLEAPAKKSASGLMTKNQVIATRLADSATIAEGTAAAVTSVVAGVATITGLAGVPTDGSALSRTLLASGAKNAGNNGKSRIMSVLDSTSVTIDNLDAVAPDANNGHITWSILDQEIA